MSGQPGATSGQRERATLLPPLRNLGLVAGGGAVGGLGRAGLGSWAPGAPGGFPWSTFAANVAGAFLLALVLALMAEGVLRGWWVRPLVATGLLGAFTTFATLSFELQGLWAEGHAGVAVAYAAATTITGVTVALGGIAVGRTLARAGLSR